MSDTDDDRRRWNTRFDPDTEFKLCKIADACEWSLDDVVRRACALYLEGEGKQILEFQEGKERLEKAAADLASEHLFGGPDPSSSEIDILEEAVELSREAHRGPDGHD